jgi:hypothetical protein
MNLLVGLAVSDIQVTLKGGGKGMEGDEGGGFRMEKEEGGEEAYQKQLE